MQRFHTGVIRPVLKVGASRGFLSEAAVLGGFGAVAYGSSLYSHPLAYIVGGILLAGVGIANAPTGKAGR